MPLSLCVLDKKSTQRSLVLVDFTNESLMKFFFQHFLKFLIFFNHQVLLGTESPDTYSDRAKYLFHADGKSLWFDKTLTVVITEDGRFGFHCEHSLADAPVYGHILEYNVTNE